MQERTDKEIWNSLRHGDKDALKTIYDEHYPYLYNYGKKIFKDITLVEDCIHDLLVEIWNRRSNLGETDSIRKYLAASLRRRIIADLKKKQKTDQVENFDQLDFEADLAIDEILINREISQEQAERLKRAFENLSARQREVIYLRFYKGLDYEQISEVVGIRYQSLRNVISGGLKKLRNEMLMCLFLLTGQII